MGRRVLSRSSRAKMAQARSNGIAVEWAIPCAGTHFHTCQWIDGSGGGCTRPVEANPSRAAYCPEHYRLCYDPVPVRQGTPFLWKRPKNC